jgi:hypothetical protein
MENRVGSFGSGTLDRSQFGSIRPAATLFRLVGPVPLVLLLFAQPRGIAQQSRTPPAPSKPIPAPAKAIVPPAKAGVGVALSPIHINDVHENDTDITGISPVVNIALSVKINGVTGVSTANANASGEFAIVLKQKAQVGNFVEVSGTAPNNTPVYGSTTVLAGAQPAAMAAKPVKLSKPSVAAAHDGDKSITASWNSADAAVAGLSLHFVLSTDATSEPLWQGDCTPDSKTGSCTVTPKQPPLAGGQVIKVTEVAVAGGAPSNSDVQTEIVAAAQGLATPTVSGSEGSTTIAATPDKADAGRSGLQIKVTILGPDANGLAGNCQPDTVGDKCTITLTKRLRATWKIQARSVIPNPRDASDIAASSAILADVTPLAALGKPAIAPPHEGDKSVSVTLNSTDVTAVKAPVQLKIRVKVNKASVATTEKDPAGNPAVENASVAKKSPSTEQNSGAEASAQKQSICIPNDSSNQCKVTFENALVEGDVITASEIIDDDQRPRESDGEAVATVVNDALGVPTIAKVRETNTAATVMLNPTDFMKWPGKLSLAVDVYGGADPLPGQSTTCSPADSAKDYCSVTFAALSVGQSLHAREIPSANAAGTPSKPGPDSIAEVQELGYNWGRVRAYFSLGTVLSRNNISTPPGSSTPAVTASNFSSPDAFAAFDMDFNWRTWQGCLAAAYINKPVRIATLADAVNQCDVSTGRRHSSNPSAPVGNSQTVSSNADSASLNCKEDIAALNCALQSTSDPSTVTILEFLIHIYARPTSATNTAGIQPGSGINEWHTRLSPFINRLKSCSAHYPATDQQGSSSTASTGHDTCKEGLNELSNIVLTSDEAQQMLDSNDGFEKRLKWGGAHQRLLPGQTDPNCGF